MSGLASTSIADLQKELAAQQAKYQNFKVLYDVQRQKLSQIDKRKSILQNIATSLLENKDTLTKSLRQIEADELRQREMTQARYEKFTASNRNKIEQTKFEYKPTKDKVSLIQARIDHLQDEWREQKLVFEAAISILETRKAMLTSKIEELEDVQKMLN